MYIYSLELNQWVTLMNVHNMFQSKNNKIVTKLIINSVKVVLTPFWKGVWSQGEQILVFYKRPFSDYHLKYMYVHVVMHCLCIYTNKICLN